MSPSHESRVQEAFLQAIELPPASRVAMLSSLRETEPDVATEVASLLDHHDRTDALLDRTPLPAGQPDHPQDEITLPARLGKYTLLRLLGEGGMGMVYEAEQEYPRRRVAVKLVRPESVSPSIIRRFEHEAHALGKLDHPSIARVFEAGSARLGDSARAYIAMELIDGPPLTRYAAEREIPPREILRIIAELCDAVQLAHRRGVIHRDLKPGNILVGSDGRPRILDFGVARLTAADDHAVTLTRAGQIVGTLAYMSPEQARGDAAEIDTRTDIYSLGAILCELLSGAAPIDTRDLSLHAALARIQSAPPRIPREIRDRLGRDVEAILHKALEKDPARRYQHASEFAADLRAYLAGAPVAARGPSRLYQFGKFCRRNRELVAAAAVVVLVAATAFGLIASALNRERTARADADRSAQAAMESRDEALEEKTRAQTNLKRAEAVSGFLRTLIGGVRPEIARGKDTTLLREVLENAESQLADLDAEPAAKGDATGMLGEVYRSIGDFDRAERYFQMTVEAYTRAFGERHELTASAMHSLGALYRGSLRRYDDAERMMRKAADIHRSLGGDDDGEYQKVRRSLTLLLLDMGRYDEAVPMLREQYAAEERSSGPDSPQTMRALNNLAGAVSMTGPAEEAVSLAREAYERRARVLGEDESDTVNSMLQLASALRAAGRPEEALPLLDRGIAVRSARRGPTHQLTLSARGHRVVVLREVGRMDEAIDEAEILAKLFVEALGASHIDTLQMRLLATEMRAVMGRCEGNLAEVDAVIASLKEQGERYSVWLPVARWSRGVALACAGDPSAEAEILGGYEELAQRVGPENRLTRRAATAAAWYYKKVGAEHNAAEWEKKAAP